MPRRHYLPEAPRLWMRTWPTTRQSSAWPTMDAASREMRSIVFENRSSRRRSTEQVLGWRSPSERCVRIEASCGSRARRPWVRASKFDCRSRTHSTGGRSEYQGVTRSFETLRDRALWRRGRGSYLTRVQQVHVQGLWPAACIGSWSFLPDHLERETTTMRPIESLS